MQAVQERLRARSLSSKALNGYPQITQIYEKRVVGLRH